MGNIPAIGVVFLELWSVLDRHIRVLGFVLEAEFFEEDDDLPWVWPAGMGVESDGLRHGECWRVL